MESQIIFSVFNVLLACGLKGTVNGSVDVGWFGEVVGDSLNREQSIDYSCIFTPDSRTKYMATLGVKIVVGAGNGSVNGGWFGEVVGTSLDRGRSIDYSCKF
jgi:hypothetical protein